MKHSTRRRPVRGLMSASAVLSLLSAGLVIGMAPSANAAAGEDPRNRNYMIQFMARETQVNMLDEWNYPVDSFWRNDMQAGLSYNYTPGYSWVQTMSLSRGGYTNIGPDRAWPSSADAYVDASGITTDTDHVNGGTAAGLGTYPETWTSVAVHVPTDGNPTPYGSDLFRSSATASGYDLDPQPMTGQPGTLDPLDAVSATTSNASSRLVPIDGSQNRAALEVVNEGGTGTYKALNGTVTIEVVKGAVGTLMNTGDTNRAATVEGATVKVTGPDQIVHTFNDADGRQTLTYEDPNTPDLLLTLRINENSTDINPYGRSTSMWASPVKGSYTNPTTDFEVSNFDIGTLYATTEVPEGGINVAPQPDADNDGLNAYEESQTFTSDTVADTDTDGLLDGEEVRTYKTDPKVADTDGDDLKDGPEVTLGTDPLVADTDSDRLNDGREHNDTGTDPLVADTDEDGLTDGEEVEDILTDPLVTDTDADTLSDGDEVYSHGTDPLVADADVDGLNDGEEIANGTRPGVADTDGDGLLDGAEVNTYKTSPLKADTDRDKLTDSREVRRTHTNPIKADSDRDGLGDGVEVNGYRNKRYDQTFKSNPLKVDSDRDGLNDKAEVTGARNKRFRYAPTKPTKADTDKDGYKDLREIKARSNPAKRSSTPRHR